MKPISTFLTTILVAFCFMALPDTAEAQVQNAADISSEEMRNMLDADRIPTHRATNTTGSPFFQDEFHEGSLTLHNGRVTKGVEIRYNSHEQNVEMLMDGNVYAVPGERLSSFQFEIGNQTYLFRKGYDARRLSEDEFVQVLADGHASLLIKHVTNFYADTPTYGQATQEDRYVNNRTYYIKIGDDVDRIRGLSQRRVMRQLDTHQDEVEEYAQSNNLDFGEAEDVARILTYYNSLRES
ncbi:MAG: hypothetical protein JJU46_02285 [Balneolaceae bacterium]|nr:hypothetical protein [Balneolaceae bacterium]